MDPVILLGGFSAFNALYPFLCSSRMVLLEPERHTLTIYPSEILEGALYQGSVSQASDYGIIKNLHITHVVNATAKCPDAFPNMLCYLRLHLSDDSEQNLVEALPLASRFINAALKAEPAGRVLVHCSMGRSRSSALTLAFLMEHRSWSLLHALRWLKERRACTAPNVNFLRQLLTYEEQLTVKISALKKGANNFFSNQFWFSGILDTWITPDELYGANLCLFSVLLTFQNPICLENAATLLCCEAPEMFRGLQNTAQLYIGIGVSR
uniref:protein-tyrosine-phosphatase n=1 Tax=Sparus aurata TaxID=8175 RepID=A0A671YU44_SPAAU